MPFLICILQDVEKLNIKVYFRHDVMQHGKEVATKIQDDLIEKLILLNSRPKRIVALGLTIHY